MGHHMHRSTLSGECVYSYILHCDYLLLQLLQIFKQAVDDCKQILPPSLLVELRAHEAKTYLRHAVPVTGIDPEIQLIIYRDFEETSGQCYNLYKVCDMYKHA